MHAFAAHNQSRRPALAPLRVKGLGIGLGVEGSQRASAKRQIWQSITGRQGETMQIPVGAAQIRFRRKFSGALVVLTK